LAKTPNYECFPSNLLLPLRLFMGATFLYAGIQHLTDPSYSDPSKPGFIGHLVTQYAVGSPIHDFLLGVVKPSVISFGYLVAAGEILIGLAILVGLVFRIACIAGLALNVTFFLSATWNVSPSYFGSDIVIDVVWLALLLTGPQANLSLDGVLSRRFSSLSWLVFGPSSTFVEESKPQPPPIITTMRVLEKAGLYPKQVREVNSAFSRIKDQFLDNEEIQTVLEMVRVFVVSLGVDRQDAMKVLDGLHNTLKRDAWKQEAAVGRRLRREERLRPR
jgi:thiosulfate dehydrogenase [quinone] large subunit